MWIIFRYDIIPRHHYPANTFKTVNSHGTLYTHLYANMYETLKYMHTIKNKNCNLLLKFTEQKHF